MLSIRDEEVRTLAKALMAESGAPTLTAAIKLALRNELDRVHSAPSLHQRVEALRKAAKAKAVRPPETARPDARDSLWER